jgi:hypothetical protein
MVRLLGWAGGGWLLGWAVGWLLGWAGDGWLPGSMYELSRAVGVRDGGWMALPYSLLPPHTSRSDLRSDP